MVVAIRSAVSLAFVIAALSFWALSQNSDERLPIEWAGPGSVHLLNASAFQVADN